jgi:hypothetical protein
VLTLTADQVEAEFVKVSTVRSTEYVATTDARFVTHADEIGMAELRRPMSSGVVSGSKG